MMNKKVIDIQSDSDDRSTDEVISWIKYLYPNTCIRTFLNDYAVDNFNLQLSDKHARIEINNTPINTENSFWYRRGEFIIRRKDFGKGSLINKSISENLRPLIDSINEGFTKKTVNKFQDNKIEKLHVLFLCHKLKISFPETIVSNKKENVLSFLKKHKKIVSKGIKYPNIIYSFNNCKAILASPTFLIDNKKNLTQANSFGPSLFQEYIEKQIEIRSFYLKGKFRSMAIFSQQNEQTKTDYRKYDYKRPNRLVPFKLPDKYEKKLDGLMKELKLDSGSFDIIYTPNGEYCFLEVNPIGQFEWLSKNCNYYIEKMIAKELMA